MFLFLLHILSQLRILLLKLITEVNSNISSFKVLSSVISCSEKPSILANGSGQPFLCLAHIYSCVRDYFIFFFFFLMHTLPPATCKLLKIEHGVLIIFVFCLLLAGAQWMLIEVSWKQWSDKQKSEKLTCSRSHSQYVMELGFEPRNENKSRVLSIYFNKSSKETGVFILVLLLII